MQKILNLARKKMRESGEYSREAFRQFLEESLEYYVEKGEISEDENSDMMLEELLERYNDVENREGDE